ncbi:hypothetical protein [Thiocapsa marina]|uniref:RNA polymerase, sigma-24 subunit, ECF subfamily n=1 Tax=Thiocapsa marina 5811 TaxID=768671 RepID=F9UHZ3_9GAMM|nr:hypothetical protein [Thiocapsa marina]EGV16169.1 hypothetical protein ThimaDRAFT_4546 [Thiocapsa marina 5811]
MCLAHRFSGLLRAWRSLNTPQNREAVKGWLFTIVRRENARQTLRARLVERG